MAAIDLASPAIADFNLAITGRRSVADHEMIGESILHPPHMPVVIIKCAGVSLARAAVMHNNELPAAPFDWRASDRVNH